jgi:hypothetical protein
MDPELSTLNPEPWTLNYIARSTSGLSRLGGRFPVNPATQFSAAILDILSRVSTDALAA